MDGRKKRPKKNKWKPRVQKQSNRPLECFVCGWSRIPILVRFKCLPVDSGTPKYPQLQNFIEYFSYFSHCSIHIYRLPLKLNIPNCLWVWVLQRISIIQWTQCVCGYDEIYIYPMTKQSRLFKYFRTTARTTNLIRNPPTCIEVLLLFFCILCANQNEREKTNMHNCL